MDGKLLILDTTRIPLTPIVRFSKNFWGEEEIGKAARDARKITKAQEQAIINAAEKSGKTFRGRTPYARIRIGGQKKKQSKKQHNNTRVTRRRVSRSHITRRHRHRNKTRKI
jgi:hypothetical protein